MTTNLIPTYQQVLDDWGISLEAARYFGLAFNGQDAFVYPAGLKSRRRVLFIQRTAGQAKNIWDNATKHLPMPVLFNAGVLDEDYPLYYLFNGEKSTLAAWTAGIKNGLNTFGEGNNVPQAVELLLQKNAPEVVIIPDCDTPGLRAAWRWQQELVTKGQPFRILDLRLYLEQAHGMTPDDYEKWDTRDLWLKLEQDDAAFQQALEDMPELDFSRYVHELPPPPPAPKSKKAARRVFTGSHIDWPAAYDEWWHSVVLPALDLVAPVKKHNSGHRHCPNPHHPDHHPSFRITEKDYPACTCGIHQMKKPREKVADWVGAQSWEDYKAELIAAAREEESRQQQDLRHFPDGIPDVLREQLLGLHKAGYVQDHAAAALVYELWHQAIADGHFSPNQSLTVADLLEYAPHTKQKTLRKGLTQLTVLGFFEQTERLHDKRGHPTYRYQAVPLQQALEQFNDHLTYRLREQAYRDTLPDFVKPDWFPDDDPTVAEILAAYENSQRQDLYWECRQELLKTEEALVSRLNELKMTFNLRQLRYRRSIDLPTDAVWETGTDYRDSYYLAHALKRYQDKQPIAVGKAAAQIGVTDKTLRVIRQRVGIVTDPRFKEAPLSSQSGVLGSVDDAFPWAAGRSFGRWLISTGGYERRVNPDTPDVLDRWVKYEMSKGYQVVIRVQTASQERPITDEEREQLAKWAERKQQLKQEDPMPRAKQMPLPLDEEQEQEPPIPSNWTPASECSPLALTRRYVEKQLAMVKRDEQLIQSLRKGMAVPAELIPYLPPYSVVWIHKGGTKGINWEGDVVDLPAQPPPE